MIVPKGFDPNVKDSCLILLALADLFRERDEKDSCGRRVAA